MEKIGDLRKSPVPRIVLHVITSLDAGGAEAMLRKIVIAPSGSSAHTVVSLTNGGVWVPSLRDAGVPVIELAGIIHEAA